MIDPGGERGRTHAGQTRLDHHLARYLTSGEPLHGDHHVAEWDAVGFDQGVERQRSGGEEVHGRLEPLVVVVVGPDDLELEDDHAVLVEPGRFEAGPDDDQRARVVELSEPRLGGAGVARAFEHHRVRLGHRLGHGWTPEHVGRHDPGGADVEGLLAPDGGRLAHRDVGDPLGTQHGDEEEPDRAGPGDEDPIVSVRRPPAARRAG